MTGVVTDFSWHFRHLWSQSKLIIGPSIYKNWYSSIHFIFYPLVCIDRSTFSVPFSGTFFNCSTKFIWYYFNILYVILFILYYFNSIYGLRKFFSAISFLLNFFFVLAPKNPIRIRYTEKVNNVKLLCWGKCCSFQCSKASERKSEDLINPSHCHGYSYLGRNIRRDENV